MTVNNVFEFLNGLFPVDTACSFDNVGLLIGDGEKEITKALVSLDCTLDTAEKAVKNGCQLIITHHPVIFSPLKNICAGSVQFELIRNGISVISMHTNLDMADGGVNDCLCNALDLQNIEAVIADDGYVLKIGNVSLLSADSMAEQIKEKLGGCVKYVDGGKLIEKVLVCSGSGGEFITEAIKNGADALITADVKHHLFSEARDSGISLFDAGHFNTEDVVIEPICKLLSDKFPDIKFITDHTTFIKFR